MIHGYKVSVCILTVSAGFFVNSARVEISETETIAEVTGLTPGETYTFFITAKNAITSTTTDIRNASVSVTLEEGGIAT